MGTNTLTELGITTPRRATGDLWDQYRTALAGDFVPRNSSAAAASNNSDLGTATYKWKDLYVDGIGYIDKVDFGTNTIYDANLTGDWAFNAGNLTGIASADITAITSDNGLKTNTLEMTGGHDVAKFGTISGTEDAWTTIATVDSDQGYIAGIVVISQYYSTTSCGSALWWINICDGGSAGNTLTQLDVQGGLGLSLQYTGQTLQVFTAEGAAAGLNFSFFGNSFNVTWSNISTTV